MKQYLFLLAVSGLALTACGGSDNGKTGSKSEVRADCDILATDPEALEHFADIGTDADGFCDCFVKIVDSKPAEDMTRMKTALTRVSDDMEDNGEGAEEVVTAIMSDAMGNTADPDTQALMDGIKMIGDAIDTIEDGFEDSGSCPVS